MICLEFYSEITFFEFLVIFFVFFCEFFLDFLVKYFCVTWLERPKGVKDKVKQTQWAQSRSGSGVGWVWGLWSGAGVPGSRVGGPGSGSGGPGGRPRSRGPGGP